MHVSHLTEFICQINKNVKCIKIYLANYKSDVQIKRLGIPNEIF